MAIFVVIPTATNTALASVLSSPEWADKTYPLPHGEWLVAFEGTSTELSEALNILDKEGTGPAIVFAVNGYYGRASVNIWEWIKSRWG